MRYRSLVLGSVLAVALAAVPASAQFYVSTTGSDSNPGTLSKPFLTLEKAQTAMQTSSTKITYLRAGTYNRSTSLVLTSSDNNETWATYPSDAAQSASLLYNGSGFLLIDINGASGITISNFTINGGTSGGGGLVDGAIFVEPNSSNIHVTKNKFVNNFNQTDLFVYNSDNIYFQGNTSGPNEFQPVSAHINDTNIHNGLFITDNNVSGFSRMGFELTVDTRRGAWGGTHIDRNVIGPYSDGSAFGGNNIGVSFVTGTRGTVNKCSTVWGNTVNGTSGFAQWGFELGSLGPASTSVEHNTMTNVDAPMFISKAVGTEIENNTITNWGNDPPFFNCVYNQDGGYNGTEWIGTNTLNGSNITGNDGCYAHAPYGTRPPVCSPSAPF